MTYLNRREAIYTREKLLVPVPEGGKDTPQKVEPGTFDRSIPVMEDPKD
jgi:NADH-quinone oxidoreductase subunit I